MTPKERAAMQQALEAVINSAHALLFLARDCEMRNSTVDDCYEAITALREALAEPQCTNSDSWNCKYCRKTETCEALAEQAEHEPVAWTNYNGAVNNRLNAAPQPVQEPECKYKEAYRIWQDKTEWVQETAHPKELGMHRADALRQRIENLQNAATHPVRTKDPCNTLQDLTDDEIAIVYEQDEHHHGEFNYRFDHVSFARAVIAADREKNK